MSREFRNFLARLLLAVFSVAWLSLIADSGLPPSIIVLVAFFSGMVVLIAWPGIKDAQGEPSVRIVVDTEEAQRAASRFAQEVESAAIQRYMYLWSIPGDERTKDQEEELRNLGRYFRRRHEQPKQEEGHD